MEGKLFMQKAYECIIRQDFEMAIEAFEQAVNHEPTNAFYRYSLSITYARSNKLNKAIEHAEEACRLAPLSNNYRLHLQTLKAKDYLHQAEQWLYKDHIRLGEAESLLKRARELDPLSIEAHLMLALAYGIQERYNEAISILLEASKLDPQHVEVRQLLTDYEWMRNKHRSNLS